MEEMMCAIALKSSNDRQTHHTQAGLLVCCEQALKGVGERNTHGGGAYRCGDLRETARAREATLRGGVKWLCLIWKAAIWRWGLPPAGELSTGNIGSLCEWQLLKALRAPCGPIPQYYYAKRFAVYTSHLHRQCKQSLHLSPVLPMSESESGSEGESEPGLAPSPSTRRSGVERHGTAPHMHSP
jgi:hypothetical protein